MNNKKDVKILIVDDQPSMLETFTDILTDKGFLVDVAEDGFQAIDKVKQAKYDIIFMDIRMPGINGVQTFREIKKVDEGAAVIMMTAYAVEDLVREAIIEGAYTVIYKPFDIERIVSTIERVLKKMLVLVVDDRLEDRETFKDLLEGRGFKVATAKTGHEAIDLVRQGNFDIIFLDIKLPDLDGVKTFEEVHKIRPEVPVIMVTGYTVEESIQQAVEKGAYTCLFKPIDVERLIRVMDEVWEIKRKQRPPTTPSRSSS
ncbi:MAG: response regulator [Deltaproteobacteria bacterium]|nr:response regulator [Deltaproteobacteria bacterium]